MAQAARQGRRRPQASKGKASQAQGMAISFLSSTRSCYLFLNLTGIAWRRRQEIGFDEERRRRPSSPLGWGEKAKRIGGEKKTIGWGWTEATGCRQSVKGNYNFNLIKWFNRKLIFVVKSMHHDGFIGQGCHQLQLQSRQEGSRRHRPSPGIHRWYG